MSDETIKPVAYADPQAFRNFAERGRLGGVYGREWMWAKPDDGLEPLYPQSTIDALRAEVDGWKGQHARDSAELRSLCAARDEWREAAALREDAERYRWIRKHCDLLHAADDSIVGWAFYNNGCAALDERVDSWMRQSAARAKEAG